MHRQQTPSTKVMVPFHVHVFGQTEFACTWEQAAQRLEALPRMIFEPDGSWIWSGAAGADRWQIDGHLFDFCNRLHRVELRGACPLESLDTLLTCFGWPETELKFELVLEGEILNEKDFRQRLLH